MTARKKTIVLVEKDGPTRDLYRRELSREYRVITCDAFEVPDLLRCKRISAVVLEIALSHGEGWNLLTAIHITPELQRVPVVVCSEQDERLRGKELGASAYLVKPVSPSALLCSLREIINFAGAKEDKP